MREDQLKNRGSSFLGFIFVLLVLILGISLIGLFYFNQDQSDNENQDIRFWLYRHAEQIVGQENTFFVFIKNQGRHNLEQVEVVLNFPQGFIVKSSSPSCSQILAQRCFWSFDQIKKGELKEIEFQGQLFGQVDQVQNFDGVLNFRLAGFSSEFQKTLSSSIKLTPSIFLTWQIPEQSSFGQKIESNLSLENISEEIIPTTQVIINWPQDFTLAKAKSVLENNKGEEIEIKESERQLKWKIDDLNPKDKKGLEFEGVFKNPLINELTFDLQAGVFENKEFFPQIEKQKKILLEKFDFNISLEANGLIEKIQSCDWGQVLPIGLTYYNQSQQTIKDFVLKLKLIGGQYVDFNRLYQSRWHYYQGPAHLASQGEADRSNSQLSSAFISKKFSSEVIGESLEIFSDNEIKGWSSDLIPAFNQILPGDEGIIIFDFPLKTPLQAAKDNELQAQVSLEILGQGKLNQEDFIWEMQGNKIELPIKTSLNLESGARYYDDEHIPLGQGPLPPQVGEETRFSIFWRIKNTTNPIKNIFVKTKLSDSVFWTGQTKTTHGLILYQEDSQEVSWQIPELSIYQGGPYSLVEAQFEVKIVPEKSQLNQILFLTEDILLTAEDQLTGDLIFDQTNVLDTNLKDDPWGQNQGIVIESKE
ncbi:hypothetical protein KKG58_03710 [Patescibacteria group bacterium]|nr:hypothetical protein [Patescibacteria group bacterium]